MATDAPPTMTDRVLGIPRRFTRPEVHPYDEIAWGVRDTSIVEPARDGRPERVVFDQRDCGTAVLFGKRACAKSRANRRKRAIRPNRTKPTLLMMRHPFCFWNHLLGCISLDRACAFAVAAEKLHKCRGSTVWACPSANASALG